MAAKTDPWVRFFDVSETKRHPKGYTIYQVKSTVFLRSSPEASTSVVVWRRYSEFRRLHKAIGELHHKLSLPGQLPPFPRATILNRFEADVVETRRLAALSLLKFIGQHNPLFTSEAFTKFFQNEESSTHKSQVATSTRKDSKGRSKESEALATTLGIQASSSLYSQLSDGEDDFSLCSSLDSPSVASSFPDAPVFPVFDVATDRIKEGAAQSSDPRTSSLAEAPSPITTNGTIKRKDSEGSNIIQNHKNIVPNRPTEESPRGISDHHWTAASAEDSVFSFPSMGKSGTEHMPGQGERHPSTSSLSSISSQPFCVYENPVHNSPKQHQKPYPELDAQEGLCEYPADIYPAPRKETGHSLPPLDVTRPVNITSRKNSVPLTPLTPLTKTVTPVIPKAKIPTPEDVAKAQYIFVAAEQISQAQQYEQQKEYKQALNMYKEGVGTLLQGVQEDGDGNRREAVRRKTAQYLQRAEQLMARLTRKDKKKGRGQDPPAELNNSGETGLKCPATELWRYRVAGSAGSVIIATDTSNGDTVAIKVLVKSGVGSGMKTVVPHDIAFMVPIVRYHETEGAIYLVLKFISGGKLWSHIRKYVMDEYPKISTALNTTSSVYTGRRLLTETSECDGYVSEALSLCETSSTASHVPPVPSPNLSCNQGTPSTNNFLTVPDLNSFGGSSDCSEASSSCLPDSYLQIFSEYTHSLPSSTSMVIPPVGQTTNTIPHTVHKSSSTGAIVQVSGYAGDVAVMSERALGNDQVLKGKEPYLAHSLEQKNKVQVSNGEDNRSIGSDTLSGVSEDFSCSISVNDVNLQPDPLPLLEAKVTDDSKESNDDALDGGEKSQQDGYSSSINGRSSNDVFVSCSDGTGVEQDIDGNGSSVSQSLKNGDEVLPVDSAITKSSTTSDNQLHVEEEREDISITDTSFNSITLPSFSWTKREDSELASLDIEDLIRNSKQLLQNVDHTLQQSKNQSVATFNDSDDSTSVEHSELPYDSVSTELDLPHNGKSCVPRGEIEPKSVEHNSFATPVQDSSQLHSQSKCKPHNHIDKNNKSKVEEGSINLISENGCIPKCDRKNTGVVDEVDRPVDSVKSQPVQVCTGFSSNSSNVQQSLNNGSIHSQSVQEDVCPDNSKSLEESLLTNSCDVPKESSLAALLEKHSAKRRDDNHPKLPEGIVKVWSSQVITAIAALHHLGIIWGDFNPDNVLLDEGGSILVTYESRWSSVEHVVRGSKSWSYYNDHNGGEVGTGRWRGYLAPELESPLGHPSTAADWWSVGALMYHMLTGQSVSAAHPAGITSHTELLMPSHLSPEAASLLSQLLCAHPTERLGGGAAGAQEIKDHPFFTGIQWTS
ncbi:ribosomal protein S6 kinase delta-1-like isoform X2 [Penaeus japonicus]|uniref:ribosomal protein S6 kinase delta-1-like isoform X2 n=1 Tax=Penaeus japonicus TaxID=27405 RepID=UPI001C713E42|nr:ribosomal protein S6 kinase delta-1-like isoform X2 [Penaeus japonicus]